MAEPIPLQRVRPVAHMEPQPEPHADAVLAAYALLRELHDHGILDFLRGLAGAGGDIATRVAEGANTPEAIAAMRNLVSLVRILGSIDPEILHGVADIVAKAPPQAEAPRFLATLKKLGSKESRRALRAAAYGLRVFGRVLIARQLGKP